jgi:hypothetical protein
MLRPPLNIFFDHYSDIANDVREMLERHAANFPPPYTVRIRSKTHPSLMFTIHGETVDTVVCNALSAERAMTSIPRSDREWPPVSTVSEIVLGTGDKERTRLSVRN